MEHVTSNVYGLIFNLNDNPRDNLINNDNEIARDLRFLISMPKQKCSSFKLNYFLIVFFFFKTNRLVILLAKTFLTLGFG